jgi:hypothetical protein
MAPGFSTTYLSTEELKSEFRNYKLRAINGELNFKLIDEFNSETSELLDFVCNTFPSDIVSGSFALHLLNLVARKNNDLDIIIPDRNRYDKYLIGSYDDEFSTPNRLGFRDIKYKKNIFSKEKTYEVDFFENKEASYLTFDYKGHKLKIHNPLEIMQFKLDIVLNPKVPLRTSRKHNEDLTRIFGQSIWQLALKGSFDI